VEEPKEIALISVSAADHCFFSLLGPML